MTIVADDVGIRKLQDKGLWEKPLERSSIPVPLLRLSPKSDTLFYERRGQSVSILAPRLSPFEAFEAGARW
jgi:hypothetical protein